MMDNFSNPVGYIEYDINEDGTLDAIWMLSTEEGEVTGDEFATGGIPGQLIGTYDVEIMRDDDDTEKQDLIFTGRLTIEPINEEKKQYTLEWVGTNKLTGEATKYTGVGMNEPADKLSALWNSNPFED